MARPVKERFVSSLPVSSMFAPLDVPPAGEVLITVEEYEAMRLVDVEGLYQEDAAKEMGISRPTLGRILAAGRRKIAKALVNGLAIRIEGGNFMHVEACPECMGIPQDEFCPRCGRGRRRRRGHGGGWGRNR